MTSSIEFAHLVAVPDSPATVAVPRKTAAHPDRPKRRTDAAGVDGAEATVMAVVVLAVPAGSYDEWLNKLTVGQRVRSSHVLPIGSTTWPTNSPDARPAENLAAGKVRMDLDQMRVSVSERTVEFTHQEYLLLKVFLQNPGRVLSRRRLLELAWSDGEWAGEGRTVDVHVRRLRAKLKTEAHLIVTVRGFGYRLDPPLAERSATNHTA